MVGRIFVCGVTAVVLALVNVSLAQDYQKDDPVVVIAHGELKMGLKVVDKVWPGLVMNVEAINGDWLWFSHDKSGWLHKSCVIPVNRQAIDRLTVLIQANPLDAHLYVGRAKAWVRVEDFSRAIDDYFEAIRLEPRNRKFSNDLGTVCWLSTDYDKAIAVFSKLIVLNPRE